MHFFKSKSRHIIFFKFCFLIISFINPSFLIYGYELCEAKESCYKDEKFNKKIGFKKKLNKTINSKVNFFNEKNINPLEIFLAFTNKDSNQSSIEIEANEQSETKDKIIKAIAYATDREDENQRKFQHALRSIGFNVKLKPYISRADGSAKGDWDVGITIDVLDSAEKAEKIILLSGLKRCGKDTT